MRRAGWFALNPPPLCFSRGPGRGRVERGSRFRGEPFTPHSEISERDHFHAETRRTRGEVMQGGERQGFAIPSFWPLRWNVGFRVDPEGGFVSAKASWPPFFGPQSGVVGRDACGVEIAGQRSRPLLRCLNKRQARAKAHLHHENSGRRSGTAILDVAATGHRLEACATFRHRCQMGNLPRQNTAASIRPEVGLS